MLLLQLVVMADSNFEPDLDEILNSLEATAPKDFSQNLSNEEAKGLQEEVDQFEEKFIKQLQDNAKLLDDDSLKILVVDDSKMISAKIKHIFAPYKVHIDHALSGNQAVDVLKEITDYDLITMDINMPGMNGIDTIKKLQENGCTIPFIIMSTESEKEKITEALLLGVKQYIVKPFQNDQVLERVNQTLSEYDKKIEIK
jgi:two-component system, chemotaxis family, chemotaxis protein CheY